MIMGCQGIWRVELRMKGNGNMNMSMRRFNGRMETKKRGGITVTRQLAWKGIA